MTAMRNYVANKYNRNRCDVQLYAEEYYTKGFTPIPLKPNSKEAAISWKEWQEKRPSWDEVKAKFEEAIARYGENINIALLCGRIHNLVVLDIDDPKKFEVAQKNMDLKIPTTPFVKTRKGYHVYFRYPEGYEVRRNERLSDWGAEIRGDGCYVAAPPSVVDSHTYRFISRNGNLCDLSIPLADVPTELLQAFGVTPANGQILVPIQPQKPISSTNNGSLLTPEIIAAVKALLVPVWKEGNRHDLSLYLAGWLAKEGYPYHDVENLILEVAYAAGDDEVRDRLRAIQDTYDKAANGLDVKGWQGLTEKLDTNLLQSLWGLIARKSQLTSVGEFVRPQNPTTDLGNAERLVRLYGDRLKYVPQWGWLVWDGKRWYRDKGNTMVTKLAEETVRTIYKEVAETNDPKEREKLAKWAIASENKQRIQAMVDLATPMCRAEPDEFDRDPYLLNCLNGIVDLRTGQLLPHDPNRKITKLCPVNYDPNATAPTWEKFLKDVFLGDADLIAYVQRALGYSLTGDVSEDVMFICWGSGSNGKTTLFNAVLAILGDYGKMIAPDALLKRNQQSDSHPTAIADLVGVRFAVAQETDEGKYLAAARVKALIGRDRIKARFMHKDYFEFDPTHKIWLSTNHKPIISDTTYAMWRRIQLIPFRAFFDESRRDKKITDKLFAEKEGILAWLVRGCLEWQLHGLNPPTIVREATKEYQTEMDKVKAWLEECCVVDLKAVTPFADLYASYEAWCKEHDEEPMGKRAFGNRLTQERYEKVKIKGDIAGRRGLRLKDNGSDKGGGMDELPINRPTDEKMINSPYTHSSEEKYQNFVGSSVGRQDSDRDHQSSELTDTGDANTSALSDCPTPTKLSNSLQQLCNFVDTEAWLEAEFGTDGQIVYQAIAGNNIEPNIVDLQCITDRHDIPD